MNSKNINANEARVSNLLKGAMNKAIDNNVPQKIDDAVSEVKVRTGVITRFYPYIDRAKVRLNHNNDLVLCKILHRYGGDIIDFYTPLDYEEKFDNKLHEPYIVPMASQNVCVLNIHDGNDDEHLILGYYQDEELVGFNPAKPGNIKLTTIMEDNQYWIKFGKDGLDYRVKNEPTLKVGDIQDNMDDVEYANVNNVYSKEENDGLLEDLNNSIDDNYYKKEDVDALLKVYENGFNAMKSLLNIQFYDGGIIGGNNNQFVYNTSYVTSNKDIEGTLVKNSDTSTSRLYWANKPSTTTNVEKDWNVPLSIEFDILNIDKTVNFQLHKSNDTGDYISFSLEEVLNNQNKTQAHFKINYKDNKFKAWIDGILFKDVTFNFISDGLFTVRFVLTKQSSFKYKNFMIY